MCVSVLCIYVFACVLKKGLKVSSSFISRSCIVQHKLAISAKNILQTYIAILGLFSSACIHCLSLLSLSQCCVVFFSLSCVFFAYYNYPFSCISFQGFHFSLVIWPMTRFQTTLSFKETILLFPWFRPRELIVIIFYIMMTRSLMDQNISWSRVIVLGRITAPQRYQVLITGMCKYYLICQKSLCGFD